MIISIPEPSDGFEKYEQVFLRDMVINMYKAIPLDRDKFIIMAHHELCYTEHELAKIFNISQVMINRILKNVSNQLKEMKKANKL